MAFDTSIGKGSFKLRQQDRLWGYFCLVVLLIAALILFTVNLGYLPLDKIKEGTTVNIAQELWQAPFASGEWLFLPLSGKSNLAQPLLPNLVALAYQVGGVSPLTTRLPSALLGALTTAILYGVGRELFKTKPPALLACCVYLTFFPVINQGRLGTVDAPLICFEMFTCWAILRSRRDLRWTLMTGFGACLVGLTNMGTLLPLAALALFFLRWDTPRLLASGFFYCGLILGTIPLVAWWLAQWYYHKPMLLLSENLAIAARPHLTWSWLIDRPFAFYLSRTLDYCSPWLIVAFYGLRLAWHHRNWGWAKFLLVASSIYGLLGILAIAQNLGFSLLIDPQHDGFSLYPILALAAGMQLAQLRNLASNIRYPVTWIAVFNCLAAVVFLMALAGKFILGIDFNWLLLTIFASVILTLTLASLLLSRRDLQFISVLIWGNYISLLLFFSSQYWIGS